MPGSHRIDRRFRHLSLVQNEWVAADGPFALRLARNPLALDGPTAGTQTEDRLEFLARCRTEPQSVPVSVNQHPHHHRIHARGGVHGTGGPWKAIRPLGNARFRPTLQRLRYSARRA